MILGVVVVTTSLIILGWCGLLAGKNWVKFQHGQRFVFDNQDMLDRLKALEDDIKRIKLMAAFRPKEGAQ